MATVQEQVLDDLYKRLRSAREVDDEMFERLKELLSAPGKRKADEFVSAFQKAAEEKGP